MTAVQQTMLGWANKYGIPLVMLTAVYLDFVRPMGIEHIGFLHKTIEVQERQADALTRLSVTQDAMVKNQELLSSNQNAVAKMVSSIAELQERLLPLETKRPN